MHAEGRLPTQLYVTVAAPNEEIYQRLMVPKSGNEWRKLKETLALLPSLPTRTVIRHTLVEGWNLGWEDEYADLDRIAKPMFIECKGYSFVGESRLRLEAEKIAPLSEGDVRDLCASFQQSVVEVVADRLRAGLKMFRERYGKPNALVAAGGVAANQAIRKVLHQVAFETGTVLVVPPAALCTDNGAMIAWAGAERLALGLTDTLDAAAHARWSLHDVTGPARPTNADAPAIEASGVTQSRMADE